MANKINLAFFNAYLELDKTCNEYFEISKGGVTTYINRLKELEFAPDKDKFLSRLFKYRKLRNIIAHEADAMSDLSEITKEDVKWLNDFAKAVENKKDPISRYRRNTDLYDLWCKARIAFIAFGIVALIVIGVIVYNFIIK